MSGVPVVISTNGFGVPVCPVDEGAPVIEVVSSGFGVPIIISDKGYPFIVLGLSSAPVNKVAPAITGTPRIGETLLGSTGTWEGTAPISYARSLRDRWVPVGWLFRWGSD